MADKIKVKMLGNFEILINDNAVDVFSPRSGQLTTLLQYLIAFRNKNINIDELTNVLWPDDTSDPSGALKNLVYRTRNAFAKCGMQNAKDCIIFKNGSYMWNNSVPCEVDVEKFEDTCKQAEKINNTDEEKIALYKQAISVYSGDFLACNATDEWVIPLNRYYHSMYFKAVYTVLDLLEQKKLYNEMEQIACGAITVEQFEEPAHQYLMKAYINQHKTIQAVNHYNYISALFYNELVVSLTDETKKIYNEAFKIVNNVEVDFDKIKSDMTEIGSVNGAFYCNYETFKSFYRLEARMAVREKISCYIALVTIMDIKNELPKTDVLSQAMNTVKYLIVESLRIGDIVSKFSATQFVILLQDIEENNVKLVLNRIEEAFKKYDISKKIKISTDLRQMDIKS